MAPLVEPKETLIRLYTQRISRKQFDNHTYLRVTKQMYCLRRNYADSR